MAYFSHGEHSQNHCVLIMQDFKGFGFGGSLGLSCFYHRCTTQWNYLGLDPFGKLVTF